MAGRARKCVQSVTGVVVTAAMLSTVAGPAEAAPSRNGPAGGIAAKLRQTMDELRFQEILDLAPPGSRQARSVQAKTDKDAADPRDTARLLANADPKPIVQQPQVDATIIELDRRGRPVSAGTVLMSPQYKHGKVVPLDKNLYTDKVRWREWDDKGWYANKGQGTVDIVPGREDAPLDFMSPYPASVLKLMVAFGILRLADRGAIGLDDVYDYRPTQTSALCGGATSKKIRDYLDDSITYSSNESSCALIKLMHDRGEVDGLNTLFQEIGLETLRLRNTNPANGGGWADTLTMTSLDTAKLLTLVNGAPGTVWTAPGGKPVTSAVLSEASRGLFQKLLADQGWGTMLSRTNFCGRKYPAAGIPQTTPKRWVGPDHTVEIHGTKFGEDVRPCDRAAEVTYGHKTGLVYNSGVDAGIVKSLPGKAGRHYIIAVFSNLGNQYQDPNKVPDPPGLAKVNYSEKFAKLGRTMDRYLAKRAR